MSEGPRISEIDVSQLIAELGRRKFWGHAQIEFRNGVITCVHEFTTLRTPQDVKSQIGAGTPLAYDDNFNR